ncbi:MAG TPA: hypothetical protein VGX03_23400 [Candidatus Binatia bacterium]|jgi:hypothetical protein|nr:hypothetical protein [Candidatus Binatia bacterium]
MSHPEIFEGTWEELAAYDSRFNRIEQDLTAIRGELALVKWMIGFNLAIAVATLWKVFSA